MVGETVPKGFSDIRVDYDKNILVSGKFNYKIDIPFTINLGIPVCRNGNTEIEIKGISSFIKVPNIVKDILIKNLVKENSEKVIYEDNKLILKKCLFDELLPFENYDIKSVSAGKEYLCIEFTNVSLADNTIASEMEDIADNDDPETEEFDIGRANDYYDKLRNKLEKYVKSRMPKKLQPVIPYLLLLPDTLALFIRLFNDKRVSVTDRVMIASGIVYIISPLDIIPDIILPFGLLDDLGIAFFVLDKLILSMPKEVLYENFNGNENIIDYVRNNYEKIKKMIPEIKMDKIVGLLNRIAESIGKKGII
jgi:Uncharacterized conserved protein